MSDLQLSKDAVSNPNKDYSFFGNHPQFLPKSDINIAKLHLSSYTSSSAFLIKLA